jgi:hypothetical protein
MEKRKIQRLEKRCTNKDKPLFSRCNPCSGEDTNCGEYSPLRSYSTKIADYYFAQRLTHPSHPGKLPRDFIDWARDKQSKEIGEYYSHS